MPRKRTRSEFEEASPAAQKPAPPSLISRIRNMWEFAAVMQFIFMFGKVLKIDEDFDIEDFENECLKPGYSEKLEDINLQLLKWVSSHRGLDHSNRDEYTRRQYEAKTPDRSPYGTEEQPRRFRDFDIFTKIRVLHQMTLWCFWNPDRMRQAMPDHQSEKEQLDWRVEEFGYDRDDRNYYLLDDNRLYRRTEPPLPALPKAKPKQNSLKALAARRRASKRRRVLDSETPDVESQDGDAQGSSEHEEKNDREKEVDPAEVDTFGGFKWECVCISLQDYTELVASLVKTKDPNEKAMRERLQEEVIPIIEAAVEKQRRKTERRERELMLMERMVSAKRSSRLANKQEQERAERDAIDAERKRKADLEAAHREQERQEKMEQERQYRRMTREQRLKEREYKLILAQEELAREAEEARRIEEGVARGSERDIKKRLERKKQQLKELEEVEEWTFDCSGCGVHGRNVDDGSHSIACERCSVWQHSKCLGISKAAAEKPDFKFVCHDCKRKEEEASRPKISLKFKVGGSSSPAPPSPAVPGQEFAGIVLPSTVNGRPVSQGTANGAVQQGGLSMGQSSPVRLPMPQTGPRQPHTYPGQQQFQIRQSASPPQQAYVNGYARPSSSGGQPQFTQQPPASHSPYYNSYRPALAPSPQSLAPRPAPLSLAQTPRQSSNSNGQIQNNTRLPSPIINRPTMSPTQGNMDVSSVAGVPTKNPPQNHATATQSNGPYPTATPRPLSRAPQTTPLSGLSPTKHRTPVQGQVLGPPSQIPTKSASPALTNHAHMRSISGTPILPPVENLRPSPEQMDRMSGPEPVPTPSKQIAPTVNANHPMASPTEAGMGGQVNGALGSDVAMRDVSVDGGSGGTA